MFCVLSILVVKSHKKEKEKREEIYSNRENRPRGYLLILNCEEAFHEIFDGNNRDKIQLNETITRRH